MLSGHNQGSSAASAPALPPDQPNAPETTEDTEAYDCIIRAHNFEDCLWRPTRKSRGFNNFYEVKKHAIDCHCFRCSAAGCGEVFNSKKEYVDHVDGKPCPGPSQSWLQGKGNKKKTNRARYVTDIAGPANIIDFLGVTLKEKNNSDSEAWKEAYEKLFPEELLPASFMSSDTPQVQSSDEDTSSDVSGQEPGQQGHAPNPDLIDLQAQQPQGDPAPSTYEQTQRGPVSYVYDQTQRYPGHAPNPVPADTQAQSAQGSLASNTYEQTQGHPSHASYPDTTGFQAQLYNQNAAFNVPGQSTSEPAVYPHPTYGFIWRNTSQRLVDQSTHIEAPAMDSRNQPVHFSHLTQPSNETTTSNDELDENMWSEYIPGVFEPRQSQTPDVTPTAVPPPQDNLATRATERIVPIPQPNNANTSVLQNSIPDLQQPQPEQAYNATPIVDAQGQQIGSLDWYMSQNEWLRQEVLSCQGNVSAVRDIFTGFQAALKVRLEGLGLTEQQDRQVDGLVRPALAAMKNVLNKAYTEGLSSEDVRAVRFD